MLATAASIKSPTYKTRHLQWEHAPNSDVSQAVPLLSVIEDMVKQRSAGAPDAALVPASVSLIWTSREREEFTLLSETIMAAAR